MPAKFHPSGDVRPGKRPSGQSGTILISCVIILSLFALYGSVLVQVVHERSIKVSLEMDRLKAIYLAEAAIVQSLSEIRSLEDPDGDGLGVIPRRPLGDGEFYADHDPGALVVIGTGEVHEIKRSIEIQYQGR